MRVAVDTKTRPIDHFNIAAGAGDDQQSVLAPVYDRHRPLAATLTDVGRIFLPSTSGPSTRPRRSPSAP